MDVYRIEVGTPLIDRKRHFGLASAFMSSCRNNRGFVRQA
jgi:hypothetical protein